MKYQTGVIVVAAGLSSRMNDFKPLMKIANSTIIETTINNYISAGMDEVVVVTGYREDDIRESLGIYGDIIRFVNNSNYETTHMFDSVCLGLYEIMEKVDFIFITPCDSPFVQQFTLKKMMEIIKNSDCRIVQPSYEGKKGHPVLISSEYVNAILSHDGTNGLHGVISPKIDGYINVSFADPGIVLDADTVQDYELLLKYNESKGCPSLELCRKIQDYFQVSDLIKSHSEKVSEVAISIYEKLKSEGIKLDKEVILAASFLHDIAKGNFHHAEVGANWLLEMGFEKISHIVREHMELKEVSEVITEKEIVFLADKLVRKNQICTIEQRFSEKEKLYKFDQVKKRAVEKRKGQAINLYDKIFKSNL